MSSGAKDNPKSGHLEIGDVRFSGGDGSAPDQAIVIEGARSHIHGVRSEKRYISRLFGQEGDTWSLKCQSLLFEDGKPIDKLTIEKAKGGEETVYFDISDFYGGESQ
jgi:hypothetical protein